MEVGRCQMGFPTQQLVPHKVRLLNEGQISKSAVKRKPLIGLWRDGSFHIRIVTNKGIDLHEL